jgi:hypothetical protein
MKLEINEVELKEIVDNLVDLLKIDEAGEALRKLKEEFDLNPFDNDGDDHEGVLAEVNHNVDLVTDAAAAIIVVVEEIVYNGRSLTNPEKHAVAKAALDRLIDLPIFLEPFDGSLFDLIIVQTVKLLNVIGWDSEDSPGFKIIEALEADGGPEVDEG